MIMSVLAKALRVICLFGMPTLLCLCAGAAPLKVSHDLRLSKVTLDGRPADVKPLMDGKSPLVLGESAFKVDDEFYSTDGQTLFAVLPHPTAKNRVMALFCPQSTPDARTAARKITHYGRYSYLVFRSDRIAKRGTWPVGSSPMVYRWPQRRGAD